MVMPHPCGSEDTVTIIMSEIMENDWRETAHHAPCDENDWRETARHAPCDARKASYGGGRRTARGRGGRFRAIPSQP